MAVYPTFGWVIKSTFSQRQAHRGTGVVRCLAKTGPKPLIVADSWQTDPRILDT